MLTILKIDGRGKLCKDTILQFLSYFFIHEV